MRVLDEEGEWRFVEDHDGKQGWMHRSVLSGDRWFRVMLSNAALYTRAISQAQSVLKWRLALWGLY